MDKNGPTPNNGSGYGLTVSLVFFGRIQARGSKKVMRKRDTVVTLTVTVICKIVSRYSCRLLKKLTQ